MLLIRRPCMGFGQNNIGEAVRRRTLPYWKTESSSLIRIPSCCGLQFPTSTSIGYCPMIWFSSTVRHRLHSSEQCTVHDDESWAEGWRHHIRCRDLYEGKRGGWQKSKYIVVCMEGFHKLVMKAMLKLHLRVFDTQDRISRQWLSKPLLPNWCLEIQEMSMIP